MLEFSHAVFMQINYNMIIIPHKQSVCKELIQQTEKFSFTCLQN